MALLIRTRPQSPDHQGWRLPDKIPEQDVIHAIEMLAAEAEERRKLGVPDPCRWYRAAWSEGVFRRALDLPNEEAARQAARDEHAKLRKPRARRASRQ